MSDAIAWNQALILFIPVTVTVIALYLWCAVALAAVFAKSGEPRWKAWVPFVNVYALLVLGGIPGWWVLLVLVPGLGALIVAILVIGAPHQPVVRVRGRDDSARRRAPAGVGDRARVRVRAVDRPRGPTPQGQPAGWCRRCCGRNGGSFVIRLGPSTTGPARCLAVRAAGHRTGRIVLRPRAGAARRYAGGCTRVGPAGGVH